MKETVELLQVAKWFSEKHFKEPIQSAHLQILCFYAQAWHYALYERPLMDEQFYAWDQGPVCQRLHNELAGRSTISSEIFDKIEPIDEPKLCSFLESVWRTYGELGPISMAVLVRDEDPWRKAHGSNSFNLITEESMHDFYLKLYKDKKKDMIPSEDPFKLRLANALDLRNMTRSQLAGRLNVSRACVNNYLSGKSLPTLQRLAQMEKILDVSAIWLLGYPVTEDFMKKC